MRRITTERAQQRTTVSAGSAATRDAGHTGVEMVVVLCLVGLVAAATSLLVTGMRTQAADSACVADAHVLSTAVAAYEAMTGDVEIAPTGDGADRFETTLVQRGFLRATSEMLDLGADGAVIIPEDSPC